MKNPFAHIPHRHQQAIDEITHAYQQAAQSFVSAAAVEQFWLDNLDQPDEQLNLLERLDRVVLGQPGTNSLYDDIDKLISWFRR